jgi:hypothetical protein
MTIPLRAEMNHLEPAFRQFVGYLQMCEIVNIIWHEPISNFCRLPTECSTDSVGYKHADRISSRGLVVPNIERKKNRALLIRLASQLPE